MRLETGFFAQAAEVTSDGRIFVHGGGIEGFIVPAVPIIIPSAAIVLRICFSAEECGTEHQIGITLADPNGNDCGFRFSVPCAPQPPPDFPSRSVKIFAVFTVHNLVFACVGMFTVNAFVDDRPLDNFSIGVALARPPIDEAREEMFLNIQVERATARPSRWHAPSVDLLRGGAAQAPPPGTKPTAPVYSVYGPVRMPVSVRTASGRTATMLLPGVLNMATASQSKVSDVGKLTVESMVQRNFTEWMNAIAITSDATRMVTHPAYTRIVALGDPAIPVILQSLRRKPSLLAWVLFDITKVNPVRPADNGKIDKITKAWLKWGKKHKYI